MSPVTKVAPSDTDGMSACPNERCTNECMSVVSIVVCECGALSPTAMGCHKDGTGADATPFPDGHLMVNGEHRHTVDGESTYTLFTDLVDAVVPLVVRRRCGSLTMPIEFDDTHPRGLFEESEKLACH